MTRDVTVRVIDTPPWQVEVYDAEAWPRDALSPDDVAAEVREYTALGLSELAKRAQQAQHPGPFGHGMSPSEIDVWTWRYPTVYSTSAGGFRSPGPSLRFPQVIAPWENLAWPMPAEVRAIAIAARPKYDALEIWTPELRRAPRIGPSPILVGVRGDRRDLLARWAEALEPFEDIARRMESRAGKKAAKIRRCYQQHDDGDFTGMCIGASLLTAGAIFLAAAGFYAAVSDKQGEVVLTVAAAASAIGANGMWRGVCRRSASVLRWACEYAGWVIR